MRFRLLSKHNNAPRASRLRRCRGAPWAYDLARLSRRALPSMGDDMYGGCVREPPTAGWTCSSVSAADEAAPCRASSASCHGARRAASHLAEICAAAHSSVAANSPGGSAGKASIRRVDLLDK